jgi:hypothetical protein
MKIDWEKKILPRLERSIRRALLWGGPHSASDCRDRVTRVLRHAVWIGWIW